MQLDLTTIIFLSICLLSWTILACRYDSKPLLIPIVIITFLAVMIGLFQLLIVINRFGTEMGLYSILVLIILIGIIAFFIAFSTVRNQRG